MRIVEMVLVSAWMASCVGSGYGKEENLPDSKPVVREWTSADGKRITAEYQGVQGADVFLKLKDGRTVPVALFKLSEADNEFVRNNRFEHREEWSAWPAEAQLAIPSVEVQKAEGRPGGFVFVTRHFQFTTDVNLGAGLMKDLATVFELTYQLHSKSPLGILAKPENGLFEARLYGKTADYHAAGGPVGTAGVYLLKDKIFLSPLDLMGVKSGVAGWRRVSREEYDTSTIVHELTHMLTHEMLVSMPSWLNEGYAEYIAGIPIEGNSFRVSREKIKQGVRDIFLRDYERAKSHGGIRPVKLSGSERRDYLKGEMVPMLFKVAKILKMTDAEWATRPAASFSAPGELSRMGRLYRTAHLIIYYYIQIEGEKGVAKIRNFIDKNQRQIARFQEYKESFQKYQKQLLDFMNLPGVSKLPDGRIQYPSSLTPPTAPDAPFTDPNLVKMSGIDALLGSETPEAVGQRIESALREDLDINLVFAN